MSAGHGRRATDPINDKSVTIYVGAILILSLAAMVTIVGTIVLRPESDNTPIIAAVIGLVTPTILSLMSLIQRSNHLALNSKLDQVVTLHSKVASAEGVLRGAALKVDPKDAEQILETVQTAPLPKLTPEQHRKTPGPK